MQYGPTNSQMLPRCKSTRRLLLDLAMSAETRTRLIEALAHIDSCEFCQAAIDDFDRIGQLLAPAQESTVFDSATDHWVAPALRELPAISAPDLRWVVRVAVAACVALALGIGAYCLGRYPAWTATGVAWSQSRTAIAPAELSSRVRAFEQVNEAFDDRAGWLLVSDTASDVGLDPQPSTDHRMLLIRLMVTRQSDLNTTAANRTVVSSADLAILPGRTAALSLPFSQARTLSYEISIGTGSPTRVGVVAELHTETSKDRSTPLAALSTTLDLRSDGTTRAGSFVTGDADYELTIGFSTAELSTGKTR